MTKVDVIYVSDTGNVVAAASRVGPPATLKDGETRLDSLVGDALTIVVTDATDLANLKQGEFALQPGWLSHAEIDVEDAALDVLLHPLDWRVEPPDPADPEANPPTEVLRATRTADLTWNAGSPGSFTVTFDDGSSGTPPPGADAKILLVVSQGTSTQLTEHRYLPGQNDYEVGSIVAPASCLLLAAGGFTPLVDITS